MIFFVSFLVVVAGLFSNFSVLAQTCAQSEVDQLKAEVADLQYAIRMLVKAIASTSKSCNTDLLGYRNGNCRDSDEWMRGKLQAEGLHYHLDFSGRYR